MSGSPLRRLRKTVNGLHRREAWQNSQDTHDRGYVLPEPQAAVVRSPGIRLAECLIDALHVAESRGTRLSVPDADPRTATSA
ncbi:hypothetical protein [Streptomyces sp. NPDC008137]|uniref:hypothetical protein n=1 Tax=Streptomyces sp. NPDC008137 TaxID=3364813 RepID=UPI0036E406FA